MNSQFTIVYFTNAPDDSITQFQAQLSGLIGCAKPFDDVETCVDFITDHPDEKFIFVTDNYGAGSLIISTLNGFSQLVHVYFYGKNDQLKETFEVQSEWRKVRFVANTFDGLYKKLSCDLIKYERHQYSVPLGIYIDNNQTVSPTSASFSSPLPVFNRTDESTLDLYVENGNFIWFQLFIEVLLRMKDDVEVQKKELVEFCKNLYKNNKCELEKLVEFESGYLSHDAVKWYTRNMCLYQLLNEALRIRNVELLVKFGFFITDIFKQLSATGLSETDECHFKVYHGQRISKNELNRLQKSIGGMLSFNSFLSTSKDRNVAVIFAGLLTDDFIAVIFEINIDRNIRDTKPYADIRQISFISEEEEILFMLGSAFRILKIDCATPDGLTTISLELCSENDQMYKDVFKHEKLKLNEDTELYHLAELLFRIGDYDLSKKYYEKYMQEHPEYSPLCKMNLALISYQKYGSNIDVEQPAHLFDSIRKMAADHGIDEVAVEEALTRRFEGWMHHHRAIMYAAEEKYDLALLSQKKALEEQLKCSTSSLPAIATSFYNIGQYHYMLQNFAEAFEYMHKALSIREKSLPATHHDLSATYFVLGCLYEQNGDYRLAHEYFTKALNIRRISTESTRIELQMCEESIKRVNKHLS